MANQQSIAPRPGKPKITRAQYLNAFAEATKGNWKTFDDLVRKVPDGEKDAVAVLEPRDLPLLRQVRRLRLASCNQHALEYYNDFTAILLSLVNKAQAAK
jgi:hypothetical protein